MVRGPPCGYHPDLTKSILVVSPQNVTGEEALFWRYGIQIVTGSQYLKGFVGNETDKERWLGEKIAGCRDLVTTLAGVACQHPQTA